MPPGFSYEEVFGTKRPETKTSSSAFSYEEVFGSPANLDPRTEANLPHLHEDARRIERAREMIPPPREIANRLRDANKQLGPRRNDPRAIPMRESMKRQIQASKGVQDASHAVNRMADRAGLTTTTGGATPGRGNLPVDAVFDPQTQMTNAQWALNIADYPSRAVRSLVLDALSDDPEYDVKSYNKPTDPFDRKVGIPQPTLPEEARQESEEDWRQIWNAEKGMGEHFTSLPGVEGFVDSVAPAIGRGVSDPMDRRIGIEVPERRPGEKVEAAKDIVGGAFEVAASPDTYLGFGGVGLKSVGRNVRRAAAAAGKADKAAEIAKKAEQIYNRAGGTVEFRGLLDDLFTAEGLNLREMQGALGEGYKSIDKAGFTAGAPLTGREVDLGGGSIVRSVTDPVGKKLRWDSLQTPAGKAGPEIDWHAEQEIHQRGRSAAHKAKALEDEMAVRWIDVEKKLPTDPEARQNLVRFALDPGVKVSEVKLPHRLFRRDRTLDEAAFADWQADLFLDDSGDQIARRIVYDPENPTSAQVIYTTGRYDVPSLTPEQLAQADEIRGFFDWVGGMREDLGLSTIKNPLTGAYVPRIYHGAKDVAPTGPIADLRRRMAKPEEADLDYLASGHTPAKKRAAEVNKQRALGDPRNDRDVGDKLLKAEYDPGDIVAFMAGPQARALGKTEVRHWLAETFGLAREQTKDLPKAFLEGRLGGAPQFVKVETREGAERYVPGFLMKQIQQTYSSGKFAQQFDKLMGVFRKTKTAANPAFHMLNVLSDSTLAWADGLRDFSLYPKLSKVLSGKGDDITLGFNPTTGKLTGGQIKRELREFGIGNLSPGGALDLAEVPERGKMRRAFERANTGEGPGLKDLEVSDVTSLGLARPGAALADYWDNLNKATVYTHHRRQGLPPRLAWKRTTLISPDYGDVDDLQRALRRVFSFSTWTRRMIPALPRIAARNPSVPMNLERLNVMSMEGGQQPPNYEGDAANMHKMNPLGEAMVMGPGRMLKEATGWGPDELLPTEDLMMRNRQPFTEGLAIPVAFARWAAGQSTGNPLDQLALATLPPYQAAVEGIMGRDTLTKQPLNLNWRNPERVFPSGTFSDPELSFLEADPGSGIDTPPESNAYMRYIPSLLGSPPALFGLEALGQYGFGAPADMVGRHIPRSSDADTKMYIRLMNMLSPNSYTVTDPSDALKVQTYSPDVQFSTGYEGTADRRTRKQQQEKRKR